MEMCDFFRRPRKAEFQPTFRSPDDAPVSEHHVLDTAELVDRHRRVLKDIVQLDLRVGFPRQLDAEQDVCMCKKTGLCFLSIC